jgi:hypothetical protein
MNLSHFARRQVLYREGDPAVGGASMAPPSFSGRFLRGRS